MTDAEMVAKFMATKGKKVTQCKPSRRNSRASKARTRTK